MHWRSFDPRLRAGGDVLQFVSDDPARVSIHASAQEATIYGREKNRRLVVSIHDSAQEATIGGVEKSPSSAFRSTPPRRRRPSPRRRSRSSITFSHTTPRARKSDM